MSIGLIQRDHSRDVMFLMFATLAKQEAARNIGADKGRIRVAKAGREDNRAFHTLCTPVRASLALAEMIAVCQNTSTE
jgi:hypothetical protein